MKTSPRKLIRLRKPTTKAISPAKKPVAETLDEQISMIVANAVSRSQRDRSQSIAEESIDELLNINPEKTKVFFC